MHINYILNLGKYVKSYIASGSFELVGNALAEVKYIYPAFGNFELTGNANVIGPIIQYSGSGSLEINGFSTVSIPIKLYKNIKFYINQTGTTTNNKKYSVYKIQGTANSPIYAATDTLSTALFDNNNLFTDSEIARILSSKYTSEVAKYESLINYINNKLNNIPLPVDNVYLSNIKFHLNEFYVNLDNQNKKVISVVGTEQNPKYVSNTQIADNANALTQPENVEYVTSTNEKSITNYENKLNIIDNKISGMTPPTNNPAKTNTKFKIKEDGYNNYNKPVRVKSVIGGTSQVYYESNEGIYKENRLLDDSEAAIYFKQKYNNNLNKYVEKLAEINGRLNA